MQGISAQEIIKLDKNWEYKLSTESVWSQCTVPNTIHRILYDSGKIPDPFFSNQEDSLQYLSLNDYQFRTSFNFSSQALSFQIKELELKSIDTYADIYLNEKKVASCNNAFRVWRIDISKFLKLGKNELRINFHSTEKIAKQQYNKLSPLLPGTERVMVRKPQYQFGWDFGPRFISCGIMDIPEIIVNNDFTLIDAAVHTVQLQPNHADLELVLEINSTYNQEIQLQWSLENQLFIHNIQLNTGNQIYRLNARFKNPILWWPNRMGSAHLYPTRLQFSNNEKGILCVKHFMTGIRKIELVSNKDKYGKGFYFKVNGRPIFAKGANYVPQDIFQTRNHDVQKILNDAFECGFNMLRIWGGGNYESDEFYETCDRLGIMIWQDFMYACAMYPGDSAFLKNATIEADEQVRRLSKFACMALWCGNNENNEAWHRWGWQIGLSSEAKDRLWRDYTKLFLAILPLSVSTFSNHTSYIESSPLYGRGDPKFQTHGDAHDWGVWHDEMNFEQFEERVPRFMSEAGFQSLPTLSTIKSFAPDNELNLESKSLLSHQKHPRGNSLINEYLQRDLPKPKNFESLIYLNQINQAEGIGIAIRAQRRAKPYCMGTLYWQFNDCWPGLSWSSRDYFGHWKALQHKTKELYQDVLISTKQTGNQIEIYASSDLLHSVDIKIKFTLSDLSGNVFFSDNLNTKLGSNQSKIIYKFDLSKWNKNLSEKNSAFSIVWQYEENESSTIHFFTTLKKLELKKPTFQLTHKDESENGFEFELKSNVICKSVYLEESENIQFFPNFIDLIPGRAIKIKCVTKDTNTKLEDIKIQSLFDHLNIEH
ncbi:MAG: glycoside hydrolase family 2 protein [Saprospiraceae bacterium]